MQLPFSKQQFFDVISSYNQSVWPAQYALIAIGLLALALACWRPARSSRTIFVCLAALWAWMGVAYHLVFFTAINPAAYLFGALCLIEAAVFLWFAFARSDLESGVTRGPGSLLAASLTGYALILYPLWSMYSGHAYPELPTFGLPCPTTIFTIGLLTRVRVRRHWRLLLVPIVWSLVGLQAAFLFDVYPDLGLGIAGLVAAALAFRPTSGQSNRSSSAVS